MLKTNNYLRILPTVLSVFFVPYAVLSKDDVVQAWLSTESLSSALERVEDIEFVEEGTFLDVLEVVIDPTIRYQTIDGWGASMTESSAILLSNHLSEAKRVQVMNDLFSEEGIGLSLLRQPIGATDFNTSAYSYCDQVNDDALETFSIERDKETIIPRVLESMQINPRLKIIASPWSPPGWMKTSGSMIGGKLLTRHYDTLARYFLKYIDAYDLVGIPIYAVTPQNEPGYMPAHYPGMLMSAEEQSAFISGFLGPTLRDSCYRNVKIICHDHNYDTANYAIEVIDSDASEFVAGSGFHHYGGPIEEMTRVHNLYPEKGIWFTEGGFGDWNTNFDNIGHELVAIPRNWSKSIVLWNIALDQNGHPSLLEEGNPNDGLIEINSDQFNEVKYNSMYFYIGHLSKFVKPGAIRISSPSTAHIFETVSFLNSDGTIATLVFNPQSISQPMRIKVGEKQFEYAVPARSLMTFVWENVDGSVTNNNL